MYNPNLHFHFTGIGGSGMSGLAEILLGQGFKVSGSDLKITEVCRRLERLGAVIHAGHAAEHVPESASALVYSSAVSLDNPEVIEAKLRGLPVIRRAEVLAELMRLKFGVGVAGSHGKTTTTSMTAAILEAAGRDPTVIIGGQVKSIGTGGKLGKGDILVAETDESDRSFLLLRPTIAVVTNIDAEHLVAYASLSDLETSFAQFVKSVPFYGLAVLCIDDPKVRDLALRFKGRKVTYGVSPDAQLRIDNIVAGRSRTAYDVISGGGRLCRIELPMLGQHIALNSLASIAVALEFGVPVPVIEKALGEFGGVGRRLEVIGEPRGITVMSDYGHHPTEVRATLRAVRAGYDMELGKLYVVFQPHRYTRTRDCFAQFLDAFSDADDLTLTDIYSAGEAPIEGVSGEALYQAVRHDSRHYVKNLDEVVPGLVRNLEKGDVVVCLGAGSVGALPEKFIRAIEARG